MNLTGAPSGEGHRSGMVTSALPPPAPVLAAFGVADAEVTSLPGGQGRSWLAEVAPAEDGPLQRLVLKPVHDAVEADEVAWLAEHLSGVGAAVAGQRFRVAAPVASHDGRWVVRGWSASAWVPGQEGPQGRWHEVLAAGEAFHAALAHLRRPAFLGARTDRWARADRAAWDEQHLPLHPDVQALAARARALARAAPLGGHGPSQLVHGDLAGNVLFDDHLAPAVIDVAPYWRPAAYAGSIVLVDALLWWGQDAALLAAAGPAAAVDLLARALLFRLLDHHEAQRDAGLLNGPDVPGLLPYRRALAIISMCV